MTQEFTARADSTNATITRLGGHWLDQWDGDLNAIYGGTPFENGTPIDWGLLFEANPRSWKPDDEHVLIEGIDWRVVFQPPGGADPRPGRETLEVPTVIVLAAVKASTLNEARDRGRVTARRVAALTALLSRYIANRTPIWEGPVQGIPDATVRFGQVTRFLEVPERDTSDVSAEFDPYLKVAAEKLPAPVGMALYWYAHAWGRLDLTDRFAALWWSALALVEAQGAKGNQKERIDAYATSLINRVALSHARASDVAKVMKDAYDTRNELFHESRWDVVSEDGVIALEETVSNLLRWEVLGT